MSEDKKKKNNTRQRVIAANGIIGNIINERKVTDKIAENVEPFLRGPAAVGLAVGIASAKKDHENIRKFAEKSNRGKKFNGDIKEKNEVVKESASVKKPSALQNAKNFVANKKK